MQKTKSDQLNKLKINESSSKDEARGAKALTPSSAANSKSSSKEPTTMEELLAQTGYNLKGFKRGDEVEGTVITVTLKHLLLDIGGKCEAVIHEKEAPYVSDLLGNLKIGDKVKVHVILPENDRGQTVVSLRRSALSKRWEVLAEKMKTGEKVQVTIREMSRGGFLVDYFGLRGFIPLSQAEPEFARLAEKAAGRRVGAKVIEVDRGANRLVFSQLAGGMSSDQQKEHLKSVEIGKTYQAEVTGLAPFGAFVTVKISDTVSLPGLIHISEIAWEKVQNPGNHLKAGQKVEVKAIGADAKTGRLTLSLKQMTPDPWEDVAKMFSVDQVVKGKVARVSEYGVFVTLLPGIDGLIHISKLAPGAEPKVGEDIECTVEQVDPEKRKISLSLVAHAKPIGYR